MDIRKSDNRTEELTRGPTRGRVPFREQRVLFCAIYPPLCSLRRTDRRHTNCRLNQLRSGYVLLKEASVRNFIDLCSGESGLFTSNEQRGREEGQESETARGQAKMSVLGLGSQPPTVTHILQADFTRLASTACLAGTIPIPLTWCQSQLPPQLKA